MYPLGLTSLPLLEIGREETSDKCFTDVERTLAYILDLEYYINYTDTEFSWIHRTLVKLPPEDVVGYGGTPVTFYLMYLCLDEDSGLPHNKNLSELSQFHDVKAYGDAFVFRMDWNASDELGPAIYIHMDEFFIRYSGTVC